MRKFIRSFITGESLGIIATIGLIVTLSFVGVDRYQTDVRDSERFLQSAKIAEALERYYDKNGTYPSCALVTASGPTVTSSVLPGLETSTLITPTSPTEETNSIICRDMENQKSGQDFFAYVGDTSMECRTGTKCIKFTLKYREESTGQVISTPSLR